MKFRRFNGTKVCRPFLITVLTGLILLLACTSTKKAPQQRKQPVAKNLAFLYNPTSTPLHPEFIVFHEGSDYSKLYLRIYPKELLFNQANREGVYMAKLKVNYETREIIDRGAIDVIDDSASINYNLKMTETRNYFIASIDFKADTGKAYLMQITTRDMLRNKETVNYLYVDKKSPYSAQNFKLVYAGTGMPSFDRIIKSHEIYRISYNRRGVDRLIVKYYDNKFPLPRPPVTNLLSVRPKFVPDSIFAYTASDTTNYIFPREGMYHIQVDPRQDEGLTLNNFGTNYPRVTSVDEMIGPLAYLSSAMEFNDLTKQSNKKLAVDNFWLESSGDADRARELIRIYYNRVFFANYFFSSYKEGWKTDRGMIYIVYGPPNRLKKNALTETWTYYRKRSHEPLNFTFTKLDNSFTDNDFQLERNFVNAMWVQAVRDWRSGKVFYADN